MLNHEILMSQFGPIWVMHRIDLLNATALPGTVLAPWEVPGLACLLARAAGLSLLWR